VCAVLADVEPLGLASVSTEDGTDGWLFVEIGFFRLCQGEPLCATCAALHRLVTLGTVLELKVLACAIIRH